MNDIRPAGETASRRRGVLRVLRTAKTPMSIIAVADVLEVHPNTARFHLERLVDDGLVEQVEPGKKGPGRPPLMFRAVKQMDRGGIRHYRLLAEILAAGFAGEPDPRVKALAAGHAWGKDLATLDSGLVSGSESAPDVVGADEAIDRLVDMLDELGFAPERQSTEGVGRIRVRHCPFLELAEDWAHVVCPIHLGLMQGVLEAWGAPVATERLETFVEPDLCLVHLSVV
jgi:predicted ArsR family transcriptional regulator